ncbi:hypothetical protein, partial [Carnobacterium iners]
TAQHSTAQHSTAQLENYFNSLNNFKNECYYFGKIKYMNKKVIENFYDSICLVQKSNLLFLCSNSSP